MKVSEAREVCVENINNSGNNYASFKSLYHFENVSGISFSKYIYN